MATPLDQLQISLAKKGFKDDEMSNYVSPRIIELTHNLVNGISSKFKYRQLDECLEYIEFSMSDEWYPKIATFITDARYLFSLNENTIIAEKVLPLLPLNTANKSKLFNENQWIKFQFTNSRLDRKILAKIQKFKVYDNKGKNTIYKIGDEYILDPNTLDLSTVKMDAFLKYPIYQIFAKLGVSFDDTSKSTKISVIMYQKYPVHFLDEFSIEEILNECGSYIDHDHRLEIIQYLTNVRGCDQGFIEHSLFPFD